MYFYAELFSNEFQNSSWIILYVYLHLNFDLNNFSFFKKLRIRCLSLIIPFKTSRCDRETGLIRIWFLPGKGETKLCLNCQDVPFRNPTYILKHLIIRPEQITANFGSNKNVKPFEKFRELFLHKFSSHAVGRDSRSPVSVEI